MTIISTKVEGREKFVKEDYRGQYGQIFFVLTDRIEYAKDYKDEKKAAKAIEASSNPSGRKYKITRTGSVENKSSAPEQTDIFN